MKQQTCSQLWVLTLVITVSCTSTVSENKEKLSEDAVAQHTAAQPIRPVHWSYTKDGGPAGWADLSPAYNLCCCGKTQSPVNLVADTGKVAGEWTVKYKTTTLAIGHNTHVEELIDNGHTIQITPQSGSLISYKGKIYHLKQFHFHSPGEHTVSGKPFPLEIHLVHQAIDSGLAVIGVLVKEGTHNDHFDQLIKHLPDTTGEKITHDEVSIDIAMNIPKDFFAYSYTGSLTTPPCFENVQWIVLKTPISMDKQQIAAFSSRLKMNNRPVQVMNERKVSTVHLFSEN